MSRIDRPPTVRTDLGAAIWAGLIAGVIFLALVMLTAPLFLEGTPWGAIWMIAGIVLGGVEAAPWAPFDAGVLVLALLVHFSLSVLGAVVLALIIHRWSLGPALIAGALYGLLLYLVNFYYLTEWFPDFILIRNWLTVFAHVSWGIGAAWAYKGLERTAPVPVAAA